MTSDELIADAAAQSLTPQSWDVTVSESKFYWYDLLTDFPPVPDFRDPMGRYLRRMQFAVEATMEKRLMFMLVSRPRLRFDTSKATSWGFFGLKLSIPMLVGADQKRDSVSIELKVPEDATLKKPTVQVFERFLTLNWGSLIETYSVHDLLQNFKTKHDFPSKVQYIGQTRDPAARLLKGRHSGVNRACDNSGPDNDNFLLIQRIEFRHEGVPTGARDGSEEGNDLLLRDQMDLLECVLIKYFEKEDEKMRSVREVTARQARIRSLQQAHMVQRLQVDLGLEAPDAFQNLYSDRVKVTERHLFESTFSDGEPLFQLLGKA
jgi:hypothetical protein